MRLIDAGAFKEYIRGACEEMSHVYKDGGKWAKRITEDFCMDIDEQPTIEERKGKWIDIDSEIYTWKVRCDKCGYERSMMSTQGKYPKFCEECGAKMEGGSNGV